MSWYIHPCKPLREEELPPELVVTNHDGSIEQVYVPYRTAKRVNVPHRDYREIGHYECSECGTPIGYNSRYCNRCGARLEDE